MPELSKPIGATCVFCDKGCTVYDDRPSSCRTFECAWLQGDLPTWARPDKIGVMIEKLAEVPVVLALAMRGVQWRTHKVVRLLKDKYQKRGIAVVCSDRLALIPEGQSVTQVMDHVATAAKKMGAIQ